MSDPSSTKPIDGRGRYPRIRKVNPKQRIFIEEYLKDFNALKAAKKAGFCQTDTKAGDRLIRLPHIATEINRRLVEVREKLEFDGDHIRQGFARIAFDPRESKKGGPTQVERMMALDRLAKIFGLYISKHVFTGATLEQLLSEADKVEQDLGPALPPPRLQLITGGKS